MTDQPIQSASIQIGGDARVYGSVVGVNTGIINTTIIQAAQIITSLHQLRAPIADFVGREHEIARLLAALHPQPGGVNSLLSQARVCAVCGMGGLGKTELCLYVAQLVQQEYPDAQLFVSLRGSKTVGARTVVDGLRDAIRAFDPLSPLPDDVDSLAALYRGHLNGKRVLIFLDDVRDVASVRPFIPPANCALLVTSRTRLSTQQWTTIDLALLQQNESWRLLESLMAYPLEPQHCDELLRYCGDLPLAIRVVGSTLADNDALTPAQYLARLRDEARRLRALKHEDQDVYAVLGLGDDLLEESNPVLARRWRMLGVCRAPFDAKTVAALWNESDEDELSDSLAHLVRRSMISYDKRTERYQIHDLLRDVARSRRTEQDDRLARLRHASYFLAVYSEADAQYRQGGQHAQMALKVFDAWWVHIRDAALWVAETPTPETDALCVYPSQQPSLLDIRLLPQELIRWCRAATEAAHRRGEPKQQAAALQGLGRGYFLAGELEFATPSYQQSIALLAGDADGTAKALLGLAEIEQLQGNWLGAEATYHKALELFEQTDNSQGIAQCQNGLGSLLQFTAKYEEALSRLEQARALFERLGDRAGVASALEHLAFVHLQQGHFAQALQYAQQQVDIATEHGDQARVSMGLYNVGVIYLQQGAYAQALPALQQSLDLATATGYKRGIVIIGIDLAHVYSRQGNYADAHRQLQSALAIALEIGFLQAVAAIAGNAGELYRQQGNYSLALTSYCYALQTAMELGDEPATLNQLTNIGVALMLEGENAKAEQVLLRALALDRKLELPADREDLYYLAELALRAGRYTEAETLTTQAMEAAQSIERGEMIFLTQLLAVRVQHAQGKRSIDESLADLTSLLARWPERSEQAAIYYTVWQLQPAHEEARRHAATMYAQLYETNPNIEYYERYRELTGQTLSGPIALPSLQGIAFDDQKTLDQLLEALDARTS